jgi:exopolyphosphatase/guanosine-5'-triphosphate,3'-diphosphate pyrophosphatase
MRLAGVDIGTLTCRLLIAQAAPDGRLSELRAERKIVRLGEGFERDHRLQPVAIARVVEVLRGWREVIDSCRVEAEVVVATSAVREAANRDGFVATVKREAGFEVEVISGEEEARRTLLGIRFGLPAGVSRVLGLDIGGGSTEFILDRAEGPPIVRSVMLGVVRLTEGMLTHDPPTPQQIRSARNLVTQALQETRSSLGAISGTTLVGTAGTVTTLAAMALRLPTYEPARIHNYRLALATVVELEKRMLGCAKEQRRGWPGLEAGREDVIVAGTIILRGVMEGLGFSECLVSDYGLREGILLDLAARLHKT